MCTFDRRKFKIHMVAINFFLIARKVEKGENISLQAA